MKRDANGNDNRGAASGPELAGDVPPGEMAPGEAGDLPHLRHARWRAATLLKNAYRDKALASARSLEVRNGTSFGRGVTRWLEDEQRRLGALRSYEALDVPADPAFLDIAATAAVACDTAIASINLIDEFREWRMVTINLPQGDNALQRSACARFVEESEVVVIPDLTEEARTREIQPANAQPAMRFYASAPITTGDGFILGRLCVVDHAARPAGLSSEQTALLRQLALQAASLLEQQRPADPGSLPA